MRAITPEHSSLAVCCRLLQVVAVCCSVLQCVAVCCSVLQCVAVRCSALQCVAVCCSVLQCVAVCCSVLTCFPNHEAVTSVLWVWHGWFIRGTWLIQTCDMTHVYLVTFSRTYEAVAQAFHAWHDYSSIHEWVMSQMDIYVTHFWNGHVVECHTHMKKSRHTYEWDMSRPPHMHESCHSSDVSWLIHTSHTYVTRLMYVSHTWKSHVVECHTHERVTSHT